MTKERKSKSSSRRRKKERRGGRSGSSSRARRDDPSENGIFSETRRKQLQRLATNAFYFLVLVGCIGLVELRGMARMRNKYVSTLRPVGSGRSLKERLESVEEELFGKQEGDGQQLKLQQLQRPNNSKDKLTQGGSGVRGGHSAPWVNRLLIEDEVSRLLEEDKDEELVRGGIIPPATVAPSDLLPAALQNLAPLDTPYKKETDTPVFWHIAKAGGTSVKHMYSECHHLVEACESGISEGHEQDETLEVVTMENGWRFVNVDVSVMPGIERAKQLDLIPSRKADLVVTPLLHEAVGTLFDGHHRVRLFTVMRQPIERVVSLFYYLQTATHEPTYNPALRNMTLGAYANSSLVESNFISRSLINKMTGPLTEQDYEIAKAILDRTLIGLLGDHYLFESVRRFDIFFGFQHTNDTCRASYIQRGANRGHGDGNGTSTASTTTTTQLPPRDSFAFQELARKNWMDLRLYRYAQDLFVEQAQMFEGRKFVGATSGRTAQA